MRNFGKPESVLTMVIIMKKKMLMILKNFTSAFDSVLTIVKTKLKSFHCKIKYLLQKAKLSNFISTLLDLTESPGSHCFLFNR